MAGPNSAAERDDASARTENPKVENPREPMIR
jgi:hypothetical protein